MHLIEIENEMAIMVQKHDAKIITAFKKQCLEITHKCISAHRRNNVNEIVDFTLCFFIVKWTNILRLPIHGEIFDR